MPLSSWGEEGTTFLPDVSVNLRGYRYVPADTSFQESGWIGGGAGLFRTHEATLYFSANVETVIGNTLRPFDANQANYHLEGGVDRVFTKQKRLNLFFHHVSRHLIDRKKDETVDWNMLGVRGAIGLPLLRGKVSGSIGHTTRASLIGYQWEFITRIDGDLRGDSGGSPYYDAGVRLVTTNSSLTYPRSSFVDTLVEGGFRWRRGEHSLGLFAAYEHRNDATVLAPLTRDWLLVGFRIGAGPSRDPWYWR